MHYWFFRRTALGRELAEIKEALRFVTLNQETLMATIEEVIGKIDEADTKLDGVRELILGLKQQVADLLSGTTVPPAVQAKIDEAFNKASAVSGEISQAIDDVPPAPPA